MRIFEISLLLLGAWILRLWALLLGATRPNKSRPKKCKGRTAEDLVSAADIRVGGYSPTLEQPLRNVATVLVALAPVPHFLRAHASLLS